MNTTESIQNSSAHPEHTKRVEIGKYCEVYKGLETNLANSINISWSKVDITQEKPYFRGILGAGDTGDPVPSVSKALEAPLVRRWGFAFFAFADFATLEL